MTNVERDALALIFDRLEDSFSWGTAQWTLFNVFHSFKFTPDIEHDFDGISEIV